ncbi:MAG: ArgE/DapE family deacylase [Gemmatimonadota bacterium]|nr:ArgE/DapE family deacylase [Gemmatimonadota bacterium]MDQ6872446.1 ArgE/DapE family deacylase [Gemmatimonadota bacterium]
MVIPRGDAVALARALIKIDSRNPTLAPDSPGEGDCAQTLAAVLDDWGFAVQLIDGAPGRPNVVARIGPANAPALMLNGHLDVVGVEGMIHEPFAGDLRNGRIYGRGSADMKGGLAATCAAAATSARRDSQRQVLVTAVVDEEYESLGMRALLAAGIRAEEAIITEPTRLAICPAHRGFAWFDVQLRGKAAHGSRYDVGIDAIMHAGLLLAELDRLEHTRQAGPIHPLLGRGSLHASTIEGGVGMSTYPELCKLAIERRTIPGESVQKVTREITDACARVKAGRPEFDARVTLSTAQLPSDVPVSAAIVKRLVGAVEREDIPVRIEGLSAWTDAALLNEAGIPTVCFGPGDIALAHAAEEFVPVDDIERATRVLSRVVGEWCGEG